MKYQTGLPMTGCVVTMASSFMGESHLANKCFWSVGVWWFTLRKLLCANVDVP